MAEWVKAAEPGDPSIPRIHTMAGESFYKLSSGLPTDWWHTHTPMLTHAK